MIKDFVYNPINDKSPAGACVRGTAVTYSLKISKFANVHSVMFVLVIDGEQPEFYPMNKVLVDDKYCHYQFTFMFEKEGLYWYHFSMNKDYSDITLMRGENLDAVVSDGLNSFLQSVIKEKSTIDESIRKGIVYHIMVDRFNKSGEVKARKGMELVKNWNTPVTLEYTNGEKRSNLCYGGNIAGITQKLSYLKSLNVSTIYLSPIFEANSYHKYDVADYSKVDSMYGTDEDLQELINKAKKQKIQVIVDGVFNHTGSDSIYFNKYGRYKTIGAYQSVNSKYYSWYDFIDYPNEYSAWWGIKSLPQTKEDSGFFDYIAGKNGIIEKYMSMGLSGFRLDVVDELTNKFLAEICKATRRINPKAYIVGEVWEDASSKISYEERKQYFLGGALDSVTNYPMKNAILEFIQKGRVDPFVNIVNIIKDQYPKDIQNNLMNIIDTHDTKRAITYFGMGDDHLDVLDEDNYKLTPKEKEYGIRLLKLATIIQYTVMGIPTVYYGDEAGMEGSQDPFCREPYPWGKEDKQLIEWYQTLGKIRENKVLDSGELNIKYAENGVLIYERVQKDKKIIVAINRSKDDFEFILEKTMSNFFTGEPISGEIVLGVDQGLILI